MRQDELTLTPFYQGWDAYQAVLVQAIAPLTEEQLALRPPPRCARCGCWRRISLGRG